VICCIPVEIRLVLSSKLKSEWTPYSTLEGAAAAVAVFASALPVTTKDVVPDWPPVVPVIVAVPAVTAVTTAVSAVFAFTVAAAAFEVVQVIVWPDTAVPALLRADAVTVVVLPAVNVALDGDSRTVATPDELPDEPLEPADVVSLTVTSAESVIPDVVARTCVAPTRCRCTCPVDVTVAMLVSRVDQVTAGLDTAAPWVVTPAVTTTESPTGPATAIGVRVTTIV
jgi:hypothetical protein